MEASVPRLSGIDASGSGDVTADGIDVDAFDVRSDGSADISLKGTAGSLRVDMDGSGDANLGDLSARGREGGRRRNPATPTSAPTTGWT